MYFLKCNHCGHFNEIKTEYMVFCQKCNKKLPVNFRDWHSRNPEKKLDDFHKEVCVSRANLNTISALEKHKGIDLMSWLAFLFVVLLFSSVSYFAKYKSADFFKSLNVPKSATELEWITEKYGQDGLTVQTPYKLIETQLPYPDNVRSLFDYNNCFANQTQTGLIVMVNCIRYKPEVENVSLQDAANGAITEMKMQPGVEDFEYQEENIGLNDIQGVLQRGVFTKEKVKMEFEEVIYANGLVLYQVVVVYKQMDGNGRLIADRVINSVAIEASPIIK